MLKSILHLVSFLTVLTTASVYGSDCCFQTFELGVGWRRDDTYWKVDDMVDSSYDSCSCGAKANSKIHFKDIDYYTINGKLYWIADRYYIRLTGMYGLSYDGRAKQHFEAVDYSFFSSYDRACVSNAIKRKSEVWDIDIAVGYPFSLFCGKLTAIPVIGFAFYRQRTNVREHKHSCSSSSCPCLFYSFSPDCFYSYSDPFSDSSSSSRDINSYLGLKPVRKYDNYRFTWYGFYAGADLNYCLGEGWVLFGEFEAHFLNNCHRKRRSGTGVFFVDDYHHQGWGYGFTGTIGTDFTICDCWFGSINVDAKWMKAHSNKDELRWQSIGVNATLGYIF